MQVKTYIAKNLQAGLEVIKQDLGPDAIVIMKKDVKPTGVMKFFKRPFVEITAGYDPEGSEPKIRPAHQVPQNIYAEQARLVNQTQPVNRWVHPDVQQAGELPEMDLSKRRPVPKEMRKQPPQFEGKTDHKLETELAEIKDALALLLTRSLKQSQVIVEEPKSKYSPELQKYLDLLKEQDVDSEVIEVIAEEAYQGMIKYKMDAQSVIKGILTAYLKQPKPMRFDKNRRDISIFLGQTGIGKSTTIAKLGELISKKYGVRLISTDIYRVAATEQLRKYAEILGLPFDVVYADKDLVKLLQTNRNENVVLIDTGKCPDEEVYKRDTKAYIKALSPNNIFLVISATTSYSSCKKLLQTYDYLEDYNVIVTKTDETSTLGSILNIAYLTQKPISYITFGQTVPDDIGEFNVNEVLDCLMSEGNDGEDNEE